MQQGIFVMRIFRIRPVGQMTSLSKWQHVVFVGQILRAF